MYKLLKLTIQLDFAIVIHQNDDVSPEVHHFIDIIYYLKFSINKMNFKKIRTPLISNTHAQKILNLVTISGHIYAYMFHYDISIYY